MTEEGEIISAPEAPRSGPSREDRATKAFLAIGLFVAIVFLIVSAGLGFTPLQESAGFLPALVAVAMPFVMVYGIADRRPWALAALTPVLWILIVEGIVSSLIALGHSSIQVPIGTLLAIWVLRAPPEPLPADATPPQFSVGSLVVVALFLVGALGQFVGNGSLAATP